MKAVMSEVPRHVVQWREQTGTNRWDEMWEGVLHMPPMPNRAHQELEGALERWLWQYWAEPGGNKVYHQINVASVGGWPDDYRIPDLVLLMPDCFHIDRNEYFEGPPTVVVEIRSPGDETEQKIPFYAQLGVPEVWIIGRDTKLPELYVLSGATYQKLVPRETDWVRSSVTGVMLRGEEGKKLAVRLAEDQSTHRLLPEG